MNYYIDTNCLQFVTWFIDTHKPTIIAVVRTRHSVIHSLLLLIIINWYLSEFMYTYIFLYYFMFYYKNKIIINISSVLINYLPNFLSIWMTKTQIVIKLKKFLIYCRDFLFNLKWGVRLFFSFLGRGIINLSLILVDNNKSFIYFNLGANKHLIFIGLFFCAAPDGKVRNFFDWVLHHVNYIVNTNCSFIAGVNK